MVVGGIDWRCDLSPSFVEATLLLKASFAAFFFAILASLDCELTMPFFIVNPKMLPIG